MKACCCNNEKWRNLCFTYQPSISYFHHQRDFIASCSSILKLSRESNSLLKELVQLRKRTSFQSSPPRSRSETELYDIISNKDEYVDDEYPDILLVLIPKNPFQPFLLNIQFHELSQRLTSISDYTDHPDLIGGKDNIYQSGQLGRILFLFSNFHPN